MLRIKYYITSINLTNESVFGITEKEVSYFFPYLPASGETKLLSDNHRHIEFQQYSSKLYSSKYRNTKAYYYLFNDLDKYINTFVSNHPEIQFIIPIGSTHSLVDNFSERLKTKYRSPIILKCLEKVEKAVFTYNSNTLINGKVLLVDDVFTSGSTIKSALDVLLKNTDLQLNEIFILCIGKTERNYIEWDEYKVEIGVSNFIS